MSPKKNAQKAQPKKKAGKSKNISYDDAGSSRSSRGGSGRKGGAVAKLILLLLLVIALAAGLVFYNKSEKFSFCSKGANASDSDTYDSEYDDPMYNGSYDTGKEQEEPQVDNSSDGSILDMFTSCGGNEGGGTADIDYDRFSTVTGSDAVEFVPWEQPADDAAYDNMMKDKAAEFITMFTQLEDMRSDLADCRTTAQVESNERYIALRSKLLAWCSSAQSFSSASLGESSHEASALANQIGADTRKYLALYPTYVISPDSVKDEAEELQAGIIDNMLKLNDIVNQ